MEDGKITRIEDHRRGGRPNAPLMFRKFVLPALAVLGVGIAIYAAVRDARVTPTAAPVSEAPQPPYRAFVAGAGIVEANSENLAIGTPIAGIVSKVYVDVGTHVKAGDPLFTIDDRAQSALWAVRQAAVKVATAQVALANYVKDLGEGLTKQRVLSLEDREKRRFAVQWAEAQLDQARAEAAAAATDLERLTVRAPIDGQVMRLKIHPGEFAQTGVLQMPLIVSGGITPLHVRVDVDENDAWRVRADAQATGYLRGNKEINSPLKFVRFEPLVIPKVSLTGDSTERVDTRVLQAIYSFARPGLPVFVGQQMDVYIDASLENNGEVPR